MNFENILLSVDEQIALLTVNRPEVRNALDRKTADEIRRVLAELEEREDVGVLILTGAGDKAFVSGADIRELKTRTALDGLQAFNQRLFTSIERFPKPVIAAVNGYALGGGCELAMACDLRVASDRAKFGVPETSLGILPGAGGTQRLPRLVGMGRAKELILTGEIIDAATAERIGLVNKVVPPEQLLPAAREMAAKILSRGPLATRLAKLATNMSAEASLDAGLVIEKLGQSILYASEDKLEGMSAFLEKRKPRFRGR